MELTTQEHPSLEGLRGPFAEFIRANLKASTLRVNVLSEGELQIQANGFMNIRVFIDSKKKEMSYELYSPVLNRSVRIEELGGFDYMESKVEEELQKLNLGMTAEDILLSADLMRAWAKSNGYDIVETTKETEEPKDASKVQVKSKNKRGDSSTK